MDINLAIISFARHLIGWATRTACQTRIALVSISRGYDFMRRLRRYHGASAGFGPVHFSTRFDLFARRGRGRDSEKIIIKQQDRV